MQHTVTVSPGFRKNASSAIFSIFLFILVFVLLIAGAAGLAFVTGYLGVFIIIAKPMWLTLLLGAGLGAMGLLVLVFVFRFVTATYKTDFSGLQEITRAEQPALFEMIDEVVAAVQTKPPRKVFLSHEVNASVFYNSSFWSMFLPVRKNLQIGLGLINSVSVSECKAILAHEFGHFSQRSMKVGSYVYHVNQILYHLLYNNDSYLRFAEKVAELHGIIAFFVQASGYIVNAIRWVLRQMYTMVNKNYMALSREMEFHADEVAALVTGPQPLSHSLQRIDLADHAFNSVIGHYNQKIKAAVITHNIYPQQVRLMQFLAAENNIPLQNGLPQAHLNKTQYNYSKLTIKDPWASHPTVEERVQRMEQLNLPQPAVDHTPARTLLQQAAETETALTQYLFNGVVYDKPTVAQSAEEFIQHYTEELERNKLHPVYHGYYNRYNPAVIPLEELSTASVEGNQAELFSDELTDRLLWFQALETDFTTIQSIANGEAKIPGFEYDGINYKASQAKELVPQLEAAIADERTRLQEHDRRIAAWLLHRSQQLGKEQEWKTHYRNYLQVEQEWNDRVAVYNNVVDGFAFVQDSHPYEFILARLEELRPVETAFKQEIRYLLGMELNRSTLEPDTIEKLENYCNSQLAYFVLNQYDNNALEVLYDAVQAYLVLIQNHYYQVRKALLDFQANELLAH